MKINDSKKEKGIWMPHTQRERENKTVSKKNETCKKRKKFRFVTCVIPSIQSKKKRCGLSMNSLFVCSLKILKHQTQQHTVIIWITHTVSVWEEKRGEKIFKKTK